MKSKKKIVSIISTTLFATASVGLIVGFSVDWKMPKWIYISGSSTVQPLINEISKIYSAAEIISEAGGSSTGIYNVVNYNKDVGATSREPLVHEAGLPEVGNEKAVTGEYSTAWSDLGVKTITIGYDGIGLIYRFANSNQYNDLVVSQQNILDIYAAFTGLNNEISSLKQIQSDLPDIQIRPYARTGGSNTSGTAEAFLNNSGFSLPEPGDPNYERWEKIENVLNSGNYGASVQQTAESNLITWSNIKANSSNNNFAYMTYLSAGFIKNNYQDIIDSGFKVALYQDEISNTPIPLINDSNELNVPNKYKWYRPLDLIVRLKGIDNEEQISEIKSFIEWLYKNTIDEPNKNLINKYNNLGYVPLDKEKWATMSLDDKLDYTDENGMGNNFWTSDYEIYQNQHIKRKQEKKFYGAR
ncbi:MAG: substrate-binding domain-containing protein [Ureaplasma sp.]|nr:substrate-binding domain-containing protein [Ureaplasma sp.]